MVINPIVGVYIPIIRIPTKGGMTISNIATFDHGTYVSLLIGSCWFTDLTYFQKRAVTNTLRACSATQLNREYFIIFHKPWHKDPVITLPETNSKSPWKWMVGIRSFPIGEAGPIFRGKMAVSFREGGAKQDSMEANKHLCWGLNSHYFHNREWSSTQ